MTYKSGYGAPNMFKRHTKYTFQNNTKCPACRSTKIVDFETEEETKITQTYRCQACGFEDSTVYDLSDEAVWGIPEYTHGKKIKWAGEFESIGQSEDEILFGA